MKMSDEEIQEFFTEDMRRMKLEAKVHLIPKGAPVFIFCLFKGRKNNVQALIDSSANCWLAKEGIPHEELMSIKLRGGTNSTWSHIRNDSHSLC